MALDDIKLKGRIKGTKHDSGGGVTYDVPMIGIVKDNIDPTRAGRIKVYLSEQGSPNSNDSANWVTVNFLSSFFGRVTPQAGQNGLGSYVDNASSYGQWQAPPDIGTEVICLFINGDPNYGFYIGAIPNPEALHMLPAIGGADSVVPNSGEAESYGGATRLPTSNFNTNNADLRDSNEFLNSPRPVHSYTAAIMHQQGIIRDPLRGPIGSSASREAVSRVGWGVATPGRPIYEGGYDDQTIASNLDTTKGEQLKVVARRGGHSLIMDDGDIIGRDQLIRLRTSLGHQILMSDDGQTLQILHSNGQSYVELGKEGTVDIYSTNSINMRTQGDFNIHADRNVNIHATDTLNLRGKTVNVDSEQDLKVRAGKNFETQAVGKYTVKAGGALALNSGQEASMNATGLTYINGSQVNINKGLPTTSAKPVTAIPIKAQTDTLYDAQKGFVAAPGKLQTVTSRAPAHYPWANAGQGVDVKNSLNAEDNIPQSPSPSVQQVNQAASTAGVAPPAETTNQSVPTVQPVSPGMDVNTTSAVLSQVATSAAQGPLSAAVDIGTAIVNIGNGAKAGAIGSFAMTPTQMASSGVIKPGSDILINKLIQAGKSIAQSLPNSMFTGIAGASTLSSFVSNTTAQTEAMVNNLQKAQKALGMIGVITGKESPGMLSGLITAAATVGVSQTVQAVRHIAQSITVSGDNNTLGGSTAGSNTNTTGRNINQFGNSVVGALTQVLNPLGSPVSGVLSSLPNGESSVTNALRAIGAGSIAGKLASLTGGLGGISQSIGGLLGNANSNGNDLASALISDRGVAGAAFQSIVSSFVPLTPGVAQSLSAIAQAAAAGKALNSSQITQLGSSLISSLSGSSINVSGVLGGLDRLGGLGSAAGALGRLGGLGSAAGALGGLAGLGGLGGLAGLAGLGGGGAVSIGGVLSFSSLGKLAAGIITGGNAFGIGGILNIARGGITGQIAGLVQNGVSGAINGALGSVTGSVGGLAPNALGSLGSQIAGAANAGLARTFTGAINNAVGGTISGALNNAVAGVVNNISAGSINNTIAGITGVASVIQHGSAASVNSLVAGNTTTIGGITGIINSTTTATANLGNIAGKVQNAVDNVTSISGAGLSGVSGGISSLIKAASATQSGSKSSAASLISSGISALPAGLNSISNVLNKAVNITNSIPGAGKLSGLIKDAQSAVMNGLPNIVNSVIGKNNSLGSLIATGLSIGEGSQLSSILASLSSSGKSQIKLPQVGFNTFAREAITAKISNLLGNPKIPLPNLLGEVPPDLQNAVAALTNISNEIFKVQDELDQWNQKIEQAKNAFYAAEQNLPQGDPTITQLRLVWKQTFNDSARLRLVERLAELGSGTRGANPNSNTSGTGVVSAVQNITSTLNGIPNPGTRTTGSDNLSGSLNDTASLFNALVSSTTRVSNFGLSNT
jgi:hypothetical protein